MHHPLHVSDRIPQAPGPIPIAADGGRRRVRGARRAVAVLALLAASAPAYAATSRWSGSNNRIYVEGGGAMSLTDIAATTPSLPPTALQHDAATGTWLLTANIIVKDGSQLDLTRNDITELRLQSNPSTAPTTDVTSFVSITADYGTININGIRITSWDTGANGPDGSPADGRAFIRARSSQDPTTQAPLVSRMDVADADVGYLGWDASESYGLSWKANGDLTVLDVLGNVTGSHIHHNFYGVYTFGLQDGQWTGNEVDHNVGYGFDGHDDTDNVVIDSNNVHDNGVGTDKANHGIILSERCDHAQITNNTSTGNGGNGIMLHDLSNDAVVENNIASNNADSGIALFCSTGASVKGNTLSGNGNGIRLSVAANSNTLEGNQIGASTAYGVFIYKGTDSNGICGSDLVPHDNVFTGNTIGTSGTNGVKITEGNNNHFLSNTLNDGISIKNSALPDVQVTEFTGNTFGDGVVLALDGSASTPVRADLSKTAHVSMELDTGATAHFTDDAGAIFDLARDLYVDVTGSSSQIDLTSDTAGAAFVVDTRPLFVTTDGTTAHVAPTLWERSGDYRKTFIVRADVPTANLQYVVGDLQPGVSYDVGKGGAPVGTFVADGDGRLSFSDATGSTATVTYALTRSAVQPQGSGGGGGGGALDGALLALLLAAAAARRRLRRIVA